MDLVEGAVRRLHRAVNRVRGIRRLVLGPRDELVLMMDLVVELVYALLNSLLGESLT